MTITRTFTTGPDRFTVSAVDTYQLTFGGGDDRLSVNAGTTTAWMGTGNDYVRLNGGLGTVYGQNGADRFDLYGSGWLANGGADNDLFNVFGGSAHNLVGGLGNDRFNFYGDSSSVHLNGGEGDDLFVGNSHSISGAIYGGAGNDRFYGFGNHDGRIVVLRGGAGNDVYRLDSDSPARVDERVGDGIDSVQIGRGVDYSLGANVENLVVLNSGSGGSEPAQLGGNGLSNRVTGGQDSEILRGFAGNDTLVGNGGSDVMYGGDGNDRMTGGSGLDYLVGGAGADTFVYTALTDAPAGTPMGSDFIADWQSIDRVDLRSLDANTELAGLQHFTSIEVAMGFPVHDAPAGTIVLAGFGGTLSILVHTDSDHDADMIIDLWSDGGEAWLTPENIIF